MESRETRFLWNQRPYHFVKIADVERWDDASPWHLKSDVGGSCLVEKHRSGFVLRPNKGEPKLVICTGISSSQVTVSDVFCCSDGSIGVVRVNGATTLVSMAGQVRSTIFPGFEGRLLASCGFMDGICFISSKGQTVVLRKNPQTTEWELFRHDINLKKHGYEIVDIASNGNLTLLLTQNELICLDMNSQPPAKPEDKTLARGEFRDGHLILSPMGNLVAIVKDTSVKLMFLGGDKMWEYKAANNIKSAAFVGEEALAFVVDNLLMFMGNDKIDEVKDGVRLVVQNMSAVCAYTRDAVLLLDNVHRSVLVMESSDVNWLVKAKDDYDNKTVTFGEKKNMDQVVKHIIVASPYIYDDAKLEKLLTAAAFGKRQSSDITLHQIFAECVKAMRVLRALRFEWGWCLTGSAFLKLFQIKESGEPDDFRKVGRTEQVEELVLNLVAADKLDVAYFVCNTYNLQSNSVIEAIAIRDIRNRSIQTEDLLKRLALYPEVHYPTIAAVVKECKGDADAFAVVKQSKNAKEAMLFTMGYLVTQIPGLPQFLEERLDGNAIMSYLALHRWSQIPETEALLFNYARHVYTIYGDAWRILQTAVGVPEQLRHDIDFRKTVMQLDSRKCVTKLRTTFSPDSAYTAALVKFAKYVELLPTAQCIYGLPSPRMAMKKAAAAKNDKLFNAIAEAFGVNAKTKEWIRQSVSRTTDV